jgi:hypothetical protein
MYDKPSKNLQDLIFPEGIPKELDYNRITTKEYVTYKYASAEPQKNFKHSYSFDRFLVSKERIKEATKDMSAKDKEMFVSQVINLLMNRPEEPEKRERFGLKIEDSHLVYSLYPDKLTRLTLDELDFIFDGKPRKSFLRSVINHLELGSSRDKLMEYIRKNRLELFRVLGKQGIQFSKEELKEIIALPAFIKITTTGTFANADTNDIINRRSVIKYQDACDGELFIEVINSIDTQDAREAFAKTIKFKSIAEKFKDHPEAMLWIKLQ